MQRIEPEWRLLAVSRNTWAVKNAWCLDMWYLSISALNLVPPPWNNSCSACLTAELFQWDMRVRFPHIYFNCYEGQGLFLRAARTYGTTWWRCPAGEHAARAERACSSGPSRSQRPSHHRTRRNWTPGCTQTHSGQRGGSGNPRQNFHCWNTVLQPKHQQWCLPHKGPSPQQCETTWILWNAWWVHARPSLHVLSVRTRYRAPPAVPEVTHVNTTGTKACPCHQLYIFAKVLNSQHFLPGASILRIEVRQDQVLRMHLAIQPTLKYIGTINSHRVVNIQIALTKVHITKKGVYTLTWVPIGFLFCFPLLLVGILRVVFCIKNIPTVTSISFAVVNCCWNEHSWMECVECTCHIKRAPHLRITRNCLRLSGPVTVCFHINENS